MTSIEITILKINQRLISAFALLDSSLDRDELFQKSEGAIATLHQLEHILFTNQILLQEIEAGVNRANIRYEQGEHKPGRYTFVVDGFKPIIASVDARKVTLVQDELQSSPDTLRLLLRDQLYRCMRMLDRLASGQGRLVSVTLPMEGVPAMDPYQALYFVAMHIQKRLKQLTPTYSAMDACSAY
jgi:hypothetical protein